MSVWRRGSQHPTLQWTWCRCVSYLRPQVRSSRSLPVSSLEFENDNIAKSYVDSVNERQKKKVNKIINVKNLSEMNKSEPVNVVFLKNKTVPIDFTQINSNFVREDVHNISDFKEFFTKIKSTRKDGILLNSFSLDSFFHDLEERTQESYLTFIDQNIVLDRVDAHIVVPTNESKDSPATSRNKHPSVVQSSVQDSCLESLIKLPKKRPPNPYGIFFTECHRNNRITGEMESIPGREMLKRISKKWHSLSKAEKQVYVDEARRLYLEYTEKFNQVAMAQKQSLEKMLFIPKCHKSVATPRTLFLLEDFKKLKNNLTMKTRDMWQQGIIRWNELPQSEKEKYIKQSEELRQLHEYQLEEYKESIPKKLRPIFKQLLQHEIKLRTIRQQSKYRESLELGRPRQPPSASILYNIERAKNGWDKTIHWRHLPEERKNKYRNEYEEIFTVYQKELLAWEDRMREIKRYDLIRTKKPKLL